MPFTAEELAERRAYLGASEAAAALGMSPFFSETELYFSKIGEGQPIEETIPMMVGTALEPVVLALLERERHCVVESRQHVQYDPTNPFRRATIDGYIWDEEAIVEAKTSGDYRGWGDGNDDIPQHYLFNAMHSLACVPDARKVIFPVLIGGRTYREYEVQRDEELIALVKSGEDAFMRQVRERTPPTPKSMADVKLLYPKSKGFEIAATPEVEVAAKHIAEIKAAIKLLETSLEESMVVVTSFMGEAGILNRMSLTGSAGAILATWNSGERRTIDADALRTNFPDIARQVTKVTPTRTYLNKIKVTK